MRRNQDACRSDGIPEVDPGFRRVVDAFAGDPCVRFGKIMASPGLKVNGKIFAMSLRGCFVAKLPRPRVDALVASGAGERLDPGHGRLMKEWIVVAPGAGDWLELAREAHGYVSAGRGVTPAAMRSPVEIRRLAAEDVDALAAAFESWPKERRLFERHLAEQLGGRRVILVAWCEMRVCGYVTVVWRPDHPPFRENGIPEIQDFNVLPAFRRRGIGSRLLDAAEELASSRSPVVGIGVGLYADYGAAQRLYVRRGYVPDGRGASHRGRPVLGGETVVADDDLVLRLTKRLRG